MPVPSYVEKWVYGPRTGQVRREIDEIRGLYPSNLASGYYRWADSQVATYILSVPSGYRFYMKRMIIACETIANLVRFYDGSALLYTAFAFYGAASTTNFLGPNEVEGLVFESAVFASNMDSGLSVRVMGLLIASTEW